MDGGQNAASPASPPGVSGAGYRLPTPPPREDAALGPVLTVELINSMALPCFAEAISEGVPPSSRKPQRRLSQIRAEKLDRVRVGRAASMPRGAMMSSLTSLDYEIFNTGICVSDPGNRPPRRLRRAASATFAPQVLLMEHEVTSRRSSDRESSAAAAGVPQPAESPPVSPVQEGDDLVSLSTRPPVYNARGEMQAESEEDSDDEGTLRSADPAEAEIMESICGEALRTDGKIPSVDSAVFETQEKDDEEGQGAAWWVSQVKAPPLATMTGQDESVAQLSDRATPPDLSWLHAKRPSAFDPHRV